MTKLRNLGAIIFTLILTSPAFSQVVINEFSASNYNQFFGDNIDWLELFNTGATAYDLSGHYLSDKLTNPTKWEFPAGTSIGPGQHLLVLLDGELDNELNGELCTNFRVTQTEANEFVVFADPDGNIIDSHDTDFPTQMNHSWGRASDGSATWRIFTTPTPDASNVGANFVGYTPRPEMDVDPGIYGGAIAVNLSCADGSATIRYTTNGNFPTNGSTAYGGPVNINNTTVLKARAYSANPEYLPSYIETNTYFFNVSHTIPIVSVSGDEIDDLLNGGGWGLEPLTTLELFDENGVLIDEVDGDSNEHGNDSNAYGQRGFDYIVRDQLGYTDEIEHAIFRTKDRDKYQRIIFKAAANDNYPFADGAHIRDAYVQSLSQIGGLRLDERSHEPCIVYVNGEYWGVYEMREKVDDIDFTDYYYDQPRHYVDFIKTWGGTWEEYGSQDEWDDLVDFILANDMTDAGNYEYVTDRYNTGSLIDYFILNSYIVSMDWLNWNTAWWRGRHPDGDKKKWRYVLWDMDATFGHYVNYTGIPDTSPNADPCNPESLGNPGGQGHVPVLNKLFDNEEFTADYLNRYADLSNSLFTCESMNHHLDSLIGIIQPEMQEQIDRWGGTYEGWEAAVQELRDFIDTRCNDVIISGMEDCYDVEAVTVTIVIEGLGEVELNTIVLNPSMSPFEGSYFSGIPIDLTALEELGGFFVNWEVIEGTVDIPDPNNPEITITVDGDVTIVAHFVEDLDPVLVQYDVMPAGAGDITVDGNSVAPYPNTVLMDAGTTFELVATPNDWYEFSHWESNNANFSPDEFANPAEITFYTTDTIIAVFEEIEHYDLTVDVFPAGAGTISMDGVDLVLPYAETLEANIDYSFITAPSNQWFEFSHWELNNHVLSPDEFSMDVILNLTDNDELVAVYNELEHYILNVSVEPEGVGTVTMDGVMLALPWSQDIDGGVDYAFVTEATDIFYEFSHWEWGNSTLTPDEFSTEMVLTLEDNEDLVAVYVPKANYPVTIMVVPPYSGTVSINTGDTLVNNTWTGNLWGETFINEFTATPAPNFFFKNWEAQNHGIATPEETQIEMVFFGTDTVVAYFTEDPYAWYVPNSFTPNGDGINDFFLPQGNAFDPEQYKMRIFNRWGEKVFETTNPNQPWDGGHEDGEYYVKDEIYFYIITVKPANELSAREYKGHIVVIR